MGLTLDDCNDLSGLRTHNNNKQEMTTTIIITIYNAGPAAWNSLPADLRVIQETAAFRRRLKTHCFNMAFNTM